MKYLPALERVGIFQDKTRDSTRIESPNDEALSFHRVFAGTSTT